MNEFWNQSHKSNSSPLMKLKCRLNNGQFNSDRLTEWEIGDEWGRGRALFSQLNWIFGTITHQWIWWYGFGQFNWTFVFKMWWGRFSIKTKPNTEITFQFPKYVAVAFHLLFGCDWVDSLASFVISQPNQPMNYTARPFQCRWI